MDQTREKLHCNVCGWEWWKRLGAPDPKRCARPSCRSMKWKGPNPARAAGDHPDELDVIPEGCPSVEGDGDPEISALEAMRPAAMATVKRVADELLAGPDGDLVPAELVYVPFEES